MRAASNDYGQPMKSAVAMVLVAIVAGIAGLYVGGSKTEATNTPCVQPGRAGRGSSTLPVCSYRRVDAFERIKRAVKDLHARHRPH